MKKVLLLVILLVLPSVYAELRIAVYADDVLNAGETYTQLFKIENLDHVSGVTDCIDVTVGYTISDKEDVFELKCLNKYKYANTGEFTPEETGNFTLCGWIINSTVIDNNKTDDIACKNITVVGGILNKTDAVEKESLIKIEDLPSEARFGDLIEIDLKVYKGDTRKYAVYIDSKIIEETVVHLKGKYTEYDLRVPLQIKPNCDGKYEEGEYIIEVKGLDDASREDILVYGFNEKMCQKEEIVINDSIVVTETKTEVIKEECPSSEKLFDAAKIKCTADLLKRRVVYESGSWKAYKLIPVLIIGVLTLLCVVLIWKR